MSYIVKKEGERLPVRTAKVYPSPYHGDSVMEYVQFVWKEPVTLRVRPERRAESVVARPLSRGIVPRLEGGEILLYLDRPMKLSLELDGSAEGNLLILAEERDYEGGSAAECRGDVSGASPEKEKQPGPQSENTATQETETIRIPAGAHGADAATQETEIIRFPAGVHEMGIFTVEKDYTVVYLEEGAYVHGKLVLSHCSHVTVCGYGVLSMERYPYESRPVYARCVDAIECRDVTVRDITIMDSNDWSLRICGCEDVLVDNVKIFGCRGNSDGIDICGSRRVLVENAFTRVWDDSLVVKALDTGDVEDVTFRGCTLWNDFARPMEVGVELRADRVHRVRFEDIDVLHSPTGYPLMGIHHGDRALVSDITFENIRIEDAPGAQLFDIRITPSYWNRDTKMGRIEKVAFRNIRVLGNPGLALLMSDSRLQGYDEEHDIREVFFEGIELCGKTSGDAGALALECRDYVEGVHFVPDPGLPLMEMVETGVEVTKDFVLRKDGLYEGEITLAVRNRASCAREKEIWLKISPEHLGIYDRGRRRVRLEAGEERRLLFSVVLQPGKYVAAIQSQDPEVRYAWKLIELDLHLRDGSGERSGEPANCREDRSGECAGEFANCREDGSGECAGEPANCREDGSGECAGKFANCPGDGCRACAMEFVNYWGDRPGSIRLWREKETLVLESPLLARKDCRMLVYAALPVKREPGEVLFSVEETDFGQVPAILDGRHGPEAAPQLRCPLEITLVFKNQPKVKEIRTFEICGGGEKEIRVPLEELGIGPDVKNFWLEVELCLPELEGYRYPCTLFHSVTPLTAAHMYGNCVL